jgi:hypothetical protein
MAKFVCEECGHEEAVPMHCGQEMHQAGDEIHCWMGPKCGSHPIPEHHGQKMKVVE